MWASAASWFVSVIGHVKDFRARGISDEHYVMFLGIMWMSFGALEKFRMQAACLEDFHKPCDVELGV